MFSSGLFNTLLIVLILTSHKQAISFRVKFLSFIFFMINFLSTKIGVNDKTPINIEKFGNTSCASIPLILTEIKSSTKNNMLVGFGVGMSMGTCIVDLEKTTFNHGVYNDKI